MDNLFISNSSPSRRNYGLGNFMLDVFMTLCTSGLWLIWIFIREMRKG